MHIPGTNIRNVPIAVRRFFENLRIHCFQACGFRMDEIRKHDDGVQGDNEKCLRDLRSSGMLCRAGS